MAVEDLRPPWFRLALKIVRRLQSVAVKQQGHAIITIRVLVKGDGNPVELRGEPLFWTEPEVEKLEPARANIVEILESLI